MSQDCPQLKYLFKFVLLLSCLIFITPANALGKIEQTYVGGNDATELVRAFNAWVDENDGESWSKVLVKEFPGIVFHQSLCVFYNNNNNDDNNKIY